MSRTETRPTGRHTEEALRRLRDAILTAALRPGERYALTRMRNIAGVDNASVQAALVELEAERLVCEINEETVTITGINAERIASELALYENVETELVREACANMSAAAVTALSDELVLLERAARLGDLDTAMLTDRRIEGIIAALPPSSDEGAQLIELKKDFKRQWCAEHRLRDFSKPIEMRKEQVDALIRGDATRAVECVRSFYASIRKGD
jgi:DNA-binding GntR family transcriptional regulator